MIHEKLLITLTMALLFYETTHSLKATNQETIRSGIKINCALHYLGKSQFKIDKKRIDIEVFKFASNNDVISQFNVSDLPKLRFLSTGYPRLGGSHKNRFVFDDHGFYIEFETLPYEQKKLMIDSLSRTYKFNATESQFINFPSSLVGRIECSFVFFEEPESVFFKGQVKNFYKYPFRVEFPARFGTKRRAMLQNKIEKEADKIDVMFTCQIKSSLEIQKQSSLVLTDEEISRLGIVESLFGPHSEAVFATRCRHVQVFLVQICLAFFQRGNSNSNRFQILFLWILALK
jgi:hypothetical protein